MLTPERLHPDLLSVIIPTLNEASNLGETLAALAHLRGPLEVLVVDGGSQDCTLQIAHQGGARVLVSSPGRGLQLHEGARAARGQVLWFLHADTRPPADAAEQIKEALARPRVVGGNFRVCFAGTSRAARFLTWFYAQLRRFGLCYGDSTLFVRRGAYEKVGGFRPFPLFEDVDLMRRLQELGPFVCVPGPVVTSSRRFEGRNFAAVFAWWVTLQVLYWIGVHPRTLGRWYHQARAKAS
jgi:rSAM/selenodomain-associated transferase 2